MKKFLTFLSIFCLSFSISSANLKQENFYTSNQNNWSQFSSFNELTVYQPTIMEIANIYLNYATWIAYLYCTAELSQNCFTSTFIISTRLNYELRKLEYSQF